MMTHDSRLVQNTVVSISQSAGRSEAAAASRAALASGRSQEVVGIQYLRGIAALLVVIYHLEPQLRRMNYTGPWLVGLSGGIGIFFVISGFIMWVTTFDRGMRPLGFWRRRVARIAPLYWVFTAAMVAIMIAAPSLLQSSRFDAKHVLASFFFIPWPHPVRPFIEPVLFPGWTLNLEMFFYVIFGLFLFTPPRLRFIGTVVCLAIPVVAASLFDLTSLGAAQFYTSSLNLEFAMGLLLGVLQTSTPTFKWIPGWVGAALLAIGLAAIIFNPTSELPRAVKLGIPAWGVVAGALILEARGLMPRIRVLHWLGDASYSIYLAQVLVLSATSQAWRRLHMNDGAWYWIGFSVTATVICCIVGLLVYTFFEKPMNRFFAVRKHGVGTAMG